MKKQSKSITEVMNTDGKTIGVLIQNVDSIAIEDTVSYDKAKEIINKLSTVVLEFETQLAEKMQSQMQEGADSIQMNGFEFKIEKRAFKVPVKKLEDLHDEVFVKEEKKLVVDTKAVNDYLKENGKLPDGFVEKVSTYPRLKRIV